MASEKNKNAEWYVRIVKNGKRKSLGPYQIGQIMDAAKKGKIDVSAELRHIKITDDSWVRARQIKPIRIIFEQNGLVTPKSDQSRVSAASTDSIVRTVENTRKSSNGFWVLGFVVLFCIVVAGTLIYALLDSDQKEWVASMLSNSGGSPSLVSMDSENEDSDSNASGKPPGVAEIDKDADLNLSDSVDEVSDSTPEKIGCPEDLKVGLAKEYRLHRGPVRAVAISEQRGIFASGGNDPEIKISNFVDGQLVHKLVGHRAMIGKLRFSPDGKFLASTITDDIPDNRVSTVARDMLKDVGARQSDEHLANDYSLRLWDAETGRQLHDFDGHQSLVGDMQFTPDGKKLIASTERKILVFDVESGNRSREIELDNDLEVSLSAIAISPDGARIMAQTNSGLMQFNLQTSQVEGSLATPSSFHQSMLGKRRFSRISFFPSGEKCVGGTFNDLNSALVVGNATNGETEQIISTRNMFWISGLGVPEHGRFLIATSFYDQPSFGEAWSKLTSPNRKSGKSKSSLRIWDSRSGKEKNKFLTAHGKCFDLDVSRNGRCAVTAHEDGTVCVWGLPDPEFFEVVENKGAGEIGRFGPQKAPVTDVALSSDGTLLLSGAGRPSTIKNQKSNILQLWNTESSELVNSFSALTEDLGAPKHLAFSQDDSMFCVVRDSYYGQKDCFAVWETNGELKFKTVGDFSVGAISRDNQVASVGQYVGRYPIISFGSRSSINSGYQVRFYGLSGSDNLAPLVKGHGADLSSISYSQSNNLIASGCGSGYVNVWESGNLVKTFRHKAFIRSLEFSKDSSLLLASAPSDLSLWSLDEKRSRKLIGHEGSVGSAKFMDDGQKIVSNSFLSGDRNSGWECEFILWDAVTGREIKRKKLLSKVTTSIKFSQDGKVMAFGDRDRYAVAVRIAEFFEVPQTK